MAKAKRYTVSDGKTVLTLEEARRGWYAVTAPMEPALHTQSRGVVEAFAMARDALRELAAHRTARHGHRASRPSRSSPRARRFNVSDGRLLLTLKPMDEGVFLVQSPMDPEILASAKSLREVFEKAYDVQRSLIASRRASAQRKRAKAAG